MAKRIQRKRTKDYTQPLGTIYVGRPTKWGNPIRLNGDCIYIDASYRRKILSPWVFYNVGDLDDVIYLFEKILIGTQFYNKDLQYWSDHFAKLDIKDLKGANLSCWCPLNKPCHADILLKYANS
jgi:hypothetical protein